MASEEMDESMNRRKRVRAAHHGLTTRLLSHMEETIASADLNRLKQFKQSLTSKVDILSKLDDELFKLVEEDQLDAEVVQADLIKEKMTLAVISIDDAMDELMIPTRCKSHTPEESPPPT